MKEKFKRLLSFIMVCMMAVSVMAVSAEAEVLDTTRTKGTLILNGGNGKSDSKYSAYKVLNAVQVDSKNVYSYELTNRFKDAQVTVEEIAALANGSMDFYIQDGTADNMAARLEDYVKSKNFLADYTLNANQKTEVDIGYYLILETTPTNGYKTIKPMLVVVPGENNPGDYTYEVAMTLKEQPMMTTKTIVESEQSKVDSAAQQVGREFTFEVVQDVPIYDDTYKDVTFKVIDTMSKGLTFVSVDSVKLNNNETPLTEGQYKFMKEENDDGTTKVTFDFSDYSKAEGGVDYYDNVKGADQVTIRYKAKLNKDADFSTSGNINTVHTEFGTNQDKVTNGTPDTTTTYSGALQLTKKGEKNAALPGAEFTVYEDAFCSKIAKLVTYKVGNDGNMTEIPDEGEAVAVTDNHGIVTFKGLGVGEYYIKETKAPNGYTPLRKPIKITVVFDKVNKAFNYGVEGNGVIENTVAIKDGVVTFDVQNTKGFTLPTTGGMGTYIFTIGGVLLIAAAVVLFIRLRKKEN